MLTDEWIWKRVKQLSLSEWKHEIKNKKAVSIPKPGLWSHNLWSSPLTHFPHHPAALLFTFFTSHSGPFSQTCRLNTKYEVSVTRTWQKWWLNCCLPYGPSYIFFSFFVLEQFGVNLCHPIPLHTNWRRCDRFRKCDLLRLRTRSEDGGVLARFDGWWWFACDFPHEGTTKNGE